jgi:hypothetical protein
MTAEKFDPVDAAPLSSGKSIDPTETKFCAKNETYRSETIARRSPVWPENWFDRQIVE